MSATSCSFENPDDLPVEHVSISVSNDGVVRQVKALDLYWIEKRPFTMYERPPISDTIHGATEAWLTNMRGYLEDLKWLLSLQYHKFWSQMIYHEDCMNSLVSFLQEANPPYLPPYNNKGVQRLYSDIRRYVFITFCRLITNKESKSEWMSKEYMSEVLYNNFIFTVPILWDICLVYGVDNGQLVSRVLRSVFTVQPRYEEDAVTAVAFVKEAFKFIILQVNNNYNSIEPPNLPETFKGFSEFHKPSNIQEKVSPAIVKDLVIHLLDTAMTLRIFVERYSKAVKIYRKTNFVNSIVQIYEYGIPHLYEKLYELDQNNIVRKEIENYLDLARAELIDVFKEILAVYKNAIFSEEGNISTHVEDYLTVMMDGLSEKLLIRDYNSCYSVTDDLEMLRQAYPDIDSVKTDFILQAIYSNLEEPIPERLQNNEPITNGCAIQRTNQEPGPSSTNQSEINEIPNKVKEESLINEVRDIFPDLGDGFILKCLQHYKFDSVKVISSILEDNLDPPLRGIDRTLPIIPEDILDNHFLATGLDRLNVFDGDEFDIMTRDDVDLTRIHVGKRRSQYKDLKDMLEDKSEIRKRLDIYQKYNLVCDEEDMYSDEYDDSTEVPEAVEPDNVREEPRRPRWKQEQESSSEEETEDKPAKPRLDFCVNPEQARARREAQWAAKRGARPPPTAARNKDVIGKPKGQGQEKEVLANRDKKEKHKSARANHSRRQGAQWKRSQGMMPS